MLFSLPPLEIGFFLERKNRFSAIIEWKDQIIPVHLANSGRMKELLIPGTKVWWHQKNTPKTRGSLWIIEKNGFPVVLHAVAANMIFEKAVQKNRLNALKDCRLIQKEYSYQNSRFDFLLENHLTGKKILTEVKSVNLSIDGTGLFPDAPTLRGKKHLEELEAALEKGYESLVVFIGLREDIKQFRPYRETDPDFTSTLNKCAQKGVKVLAYSSRWDEKGCLELFEIPVDLGQVD